MNKIIAEQKVPTSEPLPAVKYLLDMCHRFNLVPIPLKPGSKVPLVKWSADRWAAPAVELQTWSADPTINWAVRCGENLAVIDFDSDDEYFHFIATHRLPLDCPVVKTNRGHHLWVRPRRPVRSQRVKGVEIKCLGSYVVAPPSIHPSGSPYVFEVAPNELLPEVDLEALLGLPTQETSSEIGTSGDGNTAPSDFALRYGKSPYPQSLCGKATKVLTRSDGQVKHLLSLRCWKWHCRRCAPLLQRYWLKKLGTVSFRFIIGLPTQTKPTAFLRRIGKPGYIHIVVNGESWLFITGGEADRVWKEACKTGYELIAGDITGEPTPEEVREYLEKALCLEKEPLNTRRKVSHSRGLFKKLTQDDVGDESNQKIDCAEENKDLNTVLKKKDITWDSKVVMKPIEEMAKDLEGEGWRIFWKSEVEAIAIKDMTQGLKGTDIVGLMDKLGVKLKKVGKEYMGLCPLHNDSIPSLSVNKEKRLWHCFGCGKGGDIGALIKKMSSIPEG